MFKASKSWKQNVPVYQSMSYMLCICVNVCKWHICMYAHFAFQYFICMLNEYEYFAEGCLENVMWTITIIVSDFCWKMFYWSFSIFVMTLDYVNIFMSLSVYVQMSSPCVCLIWRYVIYTFILTFSYICDKQTLMKK